MVCTLKCVIDVLLCLSVFTIPTSLGSQKETDQRKHVAIDHKSHQALKECVSECVCACVCGVDRAR